MGLIVLFIVSAAVMAAMILVRRPEREDRSIASYRNTLDTLGGAAARARWDESGQPHSPLHMEEKRERSFKLKRPAVVIAAAVAVAAVAGLTTVVAQNMGTSSQSSAAPPSTAPSTTTTTAPPPSTTQPPVVPSASDEQEVVFAVGPSVSLLLVATDRCWIGARGPDEVDVFEGTLEPGAEQPIEGATPLRVRLGSPTAVDVFIDGVPAQVPAHEGTPLDLVFEGS